MPNIISVDLASKQLGRNGRLGARVKTGVLSGEYSDYITGGRLGMM